MYQGVKFQAKNKTELCFPVKCSHLLDAMANIAHHLIFIFSGATAKTGPRTPGF
jgi:hypothetical protein